MADRVDLIAACRQWLIPPGPADPIGVEAVGVEGNGRLTAVNGMLLIGLLAVEGVTILNVRGLITLHIYLGLLLFGPVLLKCASTGYRFLRYYRGRRPYLEKGPPPLVLRALGPVVVLSSLAVLGTGLGLVFTKPGHGNLLLTLHKASFIVWFAVMVVHVLGHVFEAAVLSWRELRGPAHRPRRTPPVVAGRRDHCLADRRGRPGQCAIAVRA